ncbi:virulence RhuM family protein [bacterium]|nr:virulence RhuM family protein [bacterium]MBU1883709.1 virulence RhuM family protein [bacterium]
MENVSNIVTYNDGELELDVSIEQESVWLNRGQISELFGRDVKTIGKHIGNVFNDGELEKIATVANFATVQNEGGREVKRDVEYYNLDVIISVGYRVKSQKGVRFRQWATSVLKRYIVDGYAINAQKITHERFKELENDLLSLKSKVDKLSSLIEDNSIKPSQGVFFDGQIYDAYIFVNDLIKSAKSEITLIDNYIDESVLTLFSKYPALHVKIYTKSIDRQLLLDYQKYTAQYKNIQLKEFTKAHDRFIVIDSTQIYHIGASLKDLGKKWFAFSKFEVDALDILGKLK